MRVQAEEPGVATPARVYGSRASRWYAWTIVRLRWFVVAFWLVVAAASVLYLPGIGQGGNDLSQLVSSESPAVQSEVRSFDKFGFPLLSRVSVVQRDPNGLSTAVQARAAERAQAVSKGTYPDVKPILAAVPVANTLQLLPGSKENGTTIVTMLFTAPDVTFADQVAAAERFVANHYEPDDAVVGVTGSVPARVAQGRIVLSSLPVLEVTTVAAVFLIVAFAFRSLVAPLLALAVAGIAIMLTLHVGGALALRLGVPVPQETQPLLVALLLGVVTDYVVFYLSGVRAELGSGAGRRVVAERATARLTTIIVTAGAIAAAGTGAMIVAESPVFRAFGPGMALAVLIGMIVAVTLVPALLAILGSAVFWSPRRRGTPTQEERPPAAPGRRWAWLLTRKWFAPVVVLLCLGGLIAAAVPTLNLKLGVSFVEALPGDHPARHAATAAEAGFADGMLSPTELLVQGSGVAARKAELAKLERSLRTVPGVAAVVGPGSDAVPEIRKLFESPDGTAVRYLLVLSDRPLGAHALDTLSRLEDRLPDLLRDAGLGGVQGSLGGDTAIADVMVDQTVHDLGRIALAALIANLVFLMLFLRALVVPLALLACSVLAIGATLGLTTWLFQSVLGGDGLTFYVPFAAAVLLVALGSDYNIFGVGPAWKEARRRPLREALAVTLPQSARAIRIAALTLAVSFGLLVLVPLRPFQELAFALSAGILIDAFIVRSLLVPALLTILGLGPDRTAGEPTGQPVPTQRAATT